MWLPSPLVQEDQGAPGAGGEVSTGTEVVAGIDPSSAAPTLAECTSDAVERFLASVAAAAPMSAGDCRASLASLLPFTSECDAFEVASAPVAPAWCTTLVPCLPWAVSALRLHTGDADIIAAVSELMYRVVRVADLVGVFPCEPNEVPDKAAVALLRGFVAGELRECVSVLLRACDRSEPGIVQQMVSAVVKICNQVSERWSMVGAVHRGLVVCPRIGCPLPQLLCSCGRCDTWTA